MSSKPTVCLTWTVVSESYGSIRSVFSRLLFIGVTNIMAKTNLEASRFIWPILSFYSSSFRKVRTETHEEAEAGTRRWDLKQSLQRNTV